MEMSLPNGVDVSQLVQHPVLAALPPFFLRASERYQVDILTFYCYLYYCIHVRYKIQGNCLREIYEWCCVVKITIMLWNVLGIEILSNINLFWNVRHFYKKNDCSSVYLNLLKIYHLSRENSNLYKY